MTSKSNIEDGAEKSREGDIQSEGFIDLAQI